MFCGVGSVGSAAVHGSTVCHAHARQLSCMYLCTSYVNQLCSAPAQSNTHYHHHRLEEAQEAAAGLREQLADARRRLREVLDEEKEHKKKRRAAALALATVRATPHNTHDCWCFGWNGQL